MKGKRALCVKLNTGIGRGIGSVKEPREAVSYCIKSWILSQKMNLVLTVTALFRATIQHINNDAIMKPDEFVLKLYSVNPSVYMTDHFLISFRGTDSTEQPVCPTDTGR